MESKQEPSVPGNLGPDNTRGPSDDGGQPGSSSRSSYLAGRSTASPRTTAHGSGSSLVSGSGEDGETSRGSSGAASVVASTGTGGLLASGVGALHLSTTPLENREWESLSREQRKRLRRRNRAREVEGARGAAGTAVAEPRMGQPVANPPPGTKRKRREGETPPSDKREGKRSKGGTYAGTLRQELQVGFVYEGAERTPLTEEDGLHIRNHLINRSWETAKTLRKGETPPRFERNGLVDEGWFLLTCADEMTVAWTLRQVVPPIGDRQFRAMRAAELPKPMRLAIRLPESKSEAKEILEKLELYNPGVNATSWRVVSFRKEGKGLLLIALADEAVGQLLEEQGWRLYFELTRVVVFKLGSRAAAPPPEEEGEATESEGPGR